MRLIRNRFVQEGIFGELQQDSGEHICYTLTHAFIQPDKTYLPATPNGTYTCQKRLSPHFGYDVFEILNVPGHDYIECHPGNYNSDSDGCELLGQTTSPIMIGNSQDAFKAFMSALENVNSFILVVE